MNQRPILPETKPGPGFRIKGDFDRLDPEIIKGLSEFEVPEISDQLNSIYAFSPEIRCLTGSHHELFGPACTVRVFPVDNLMVHKSLDIAKPGDVIVVDARGTCMNAILGDIICLKAKHRGIAGFIVDGYVRDLPSILALDFPVFAKGTTPIGPLHRGPGEVNYPISCGGVVVNAGDIMVAQQSGIVCIPRENAHEILERLTIKREKNKEYISNVKKGVFSNKWVDDALKAANCQFVD